MSPREQAEAVVLLQRWLKIFDESIAGDASLPPRLAARLQLLSEQTREFTGAGDDAEASS